MKYVFWNKDIDITFSQDNMIIYIPGTARGK